MKRTATTITDILDYIRELCGSDGPGRTDEEITNYLNERNDRWSFGEDMNVEPRALYPDGTQIPHGLRSTIDEMFDSGWIWGEAVDGEITADDLRMLGMITTRNEAGRHFTETHAADWLNRMEAAGLIEINRPVHQTGIAYSQEYWSVQVTEEGIALGEASNWGEE